MRKLIAGNWKMNGSLAANEALVKAMLDGLGGQPPKADMALCAPAPYLAQLAGLLGGGPIAWGAQDVSSHEQGAYTGEVSVSMLKDFACRYVIVGHSERRQYHGETDALVASKAQRALSAGVTPIVCVGETLAEREAGHTELVVKRQLAAVIHTVAHCTSEIVVAYEPVWAIGTGLNASPEQAQEIHAYIRKLIANQFNEELAASTSILYGGSVKPENAAALFLQADIDGGLIGGASLKARDFIDIVKAMR